MFQKNFVSVIALVLALISLVLAGLALVKVNRVEHDYNAKISHLDGSSVNQEETPNATQPPVSINLTNWTLTPKAQPDSKNADIAFTATVETDIADLTGNLMISLNGESVADIICAFSKNNLSADVSLPAANGYTYKLVFSTPEGVVQEIVLASPEDPANTTAVYLADSLNSYCNLLVEDWTATKDTLTINSGYVQLQLPQLMATAGKTSWESARLVLKSNQKEVASHDLKLETGEGSNSYELTLQSVALDLPALKEGQELTLWLEITLSNGQIVTSSGAGWFLEGNELNFVVG